MKNILTYEKYCIHIGRDRARADMNSQINKIAIRHLLTMSSGIIINSFDPSIMKQTRRYSR